MSSSKDSFSKIFLKKYLGIIPHILSVIAVEFLWPILGSGPLYTRVGKQILQDCKSNWWKHLVLMGNQSPEEACVGHTFFTTVNLQLTILGLLVIYLLRKRVFVGVAFASFVSVGSLVWLFHILEGVKTPLLMTPNVKWPEAANYLMRAHFPTNPHVPCFLMGLLTCFFVRRGGLTIYPTSWRNTCIHIYLACCFLAVTSFSPALHNIYNLIPEHYYPHYIIAVKVLFVFIVSPTILTSVAFSPPVVRKRIPVHDDNNNNQTGDIRVRHDNNNNVSLDSTVKQDEKAEYSFMKGLERLSLAMHLINYFFIKYDYLSSRMLMDVDGYNLLKRTCSSLTCIVIIGFFFHIFFVAPVSGLIHCFLFDKKEIAKQKHDKTL